MAKKKASTRKSTPTKKTESKKGFWAQPAPEVEAAAPAPEPPPAPVPPAPKPPPPPPPPPPPKPATPVDQAEAALKAYWGATGPDRDFQAGRKAVRELNLNVHQLREVEDRLPPRGSGDTGDRIAECYRFLDRLGA